MNVIVKTGEPSTIERIFNDIVLERARQDAKFGEQQNTLPEWMTILTEEVGETAREVTDYYFKYPQKGNASIDTDVVQDKRLDAIKSELNQVISVAVSILEKLHNQQPAILKTRDLVMRSETVSVNDSASKSYDSAVTIKHTYQIEHEEEQ